MVWLFLIGAAFFVLGGLLAVQPTKTQKRIATLRESARAEGLHVKLPVSLKFPDNVVKSERPYYCKNLVDRRLAHQFVHALRGENGQIKCAGSKALESVFSSRLASLPPEFDAIYLGGGLLAVSWNESRVSVVPKTLLECLADLEAELQSSV